MSFSRPALPVRARLAAAIVTSFAALLLFSSATPFVQAQSDEPAPGAQRPRGGPPNPPNQPRSATPLPGLTSDQLADFNDGQEDFEEREDRAGGLGPIFNRDSCVACHSEPAVGGSSRITVTRFGRTTNGVFDPLASLGGSLLQERAISPNGLERVPREANVVARRQTTPLFGLGLIEAIPDAAILRGVRNTPVDGVLGRASMVQDVATGRTLVGRFGWKAQHATLLAFSGDAYLNEMGVTNRLFPTENAPNGNATLLRQLDRVADPEDEEDDDGKADIDRLTDFMRFLAPLPTQPVTPNTTFGAKIFLDTGCTTCHTPMMMTGASNILALSSKPVFLYSDLLLHDMGTLGDGIAQGTARPRDMKTPPLWGLRASGPYLHDGRAATIEDAIRAHAGEGTASRDRFLRLTRDQQALLVEFLKSI